MNVFHLTKILTSALLCISFSSAELYCGRPLHFLSKPTANLLYYSSPKIKKEKTLCHMASLDSDGSVCYLPFGWVIQIFFY